LDNLLETNNVTNSTPQPETNSIRQGFLRKMHCYAVSMYIIKGTSIGKKQH